MSCNIPETSKKFSETLAGAKDKMNSLVADADKGIASALASLQGDLAAEKEKLCKQQSIRELKERKISFELC